MKARSELDYAANLPAVNRNALSLQPTEAYLEWTRACPDSEPDLTLEDLLDDHTVYLITEVEDHAEEWLKQNYLVLFQQELSAWCTDEVFWPQDRSFNAFKKFFNISFSSMVFDLDKGSIERK